MDIKSILDQHRKQKTTDMPVIKEMAQYLLSDTLKAVIQEFNDKIKALITDFDSEIVNLEENFRSEVSKIQNDLNKKGDKGDPGESIKGEPGKDYILTNSDRIDIASKIKVPIVEKVIEKTEVRQPIITNEIKEVAKYETPEQIADKLNTLEEKVDIKVIRGLSNWLTNIKNSIREKKLGGGGGMGNWITEAPSGLINDLNTTYTLTSTPASNGKALILLYQGQVMEFGNQFTISGNTITTLFTPETGTSLFAMYSRS